MIVFIQFITYKWILLQWVEQIIIKVYDYLLDPLRHIVSFVRAITMFYLCFLFIFFRFPLGFSRSQTCLMAYIFPQELDVKPNVKNFGIIEIAFVRANLWNQRVERKISALLNVGMHRYTFIRYCMLFSHVYLLQASHTVKANNSCLVSANKTFTTRTHK